MKQHNLWVEWVKLALLFLITFIICILIVIYVPSYPYVQPEHRNEYKAEPWPIETIIVF